MMNNFIKINVVKKNIDTDYMNINLPKWYNYAKTETKIAYYILSIMYYNIFKKNLNINNIVKNNTGKPIFQNDNIHFNITHSSHFIAVALASFNVGIDIEEERKISKNTIKKIVCSEDNIHNVLKIWNIKEAYSKYLGIGLRLNFAKTSINAIKKECIIKNYDKIIENNIKTYLSVCYSQYYKEIIPNINYIKI